MNNQPAEQKKKTAPPAAPPHNQAASPLPDNPRDHGSAIHAAPCTPADADAWDAYVQACPDSTVFHRRAWSEAVAEAYGHQPRHLIAHAHGRTVGLLPLFEVRSLLAGRLLVSLPYATYGGILADSAEAAAALLDAAKRLCHKRHARYLELRHRESRGLDLPVLGRYDTFRKPLPDRPEDILPALPRKTRTAARHGLKALGTEAGRFGPDLLDTIYDLYAATMRRLGSPNYSRRFFHALARAYGRDCACLLVRDGEKPIAGVVSFIWKDEIVPYFSGSLPEALPKRANNLMYLRLMEWAAGRGLKRFDFNRTRRDNRGPYDFKRHHGFDPAPLCYNVYLNNGRDLPNLSPSNRTFALAGHLWKQLPLWLTRSAGARVTRWIP